MACVFCEIVAGTAPAIRIYEDDDYLGFLDIRPFTRGPPWRSLSDTPSTSHRHPGGDGGQDGGGRQRIAKGSSGVRAGRDGTNRHQRRQVGIPVGVPFTCTWCRGATATKAAFVKGMVLRRDPDREASGRLLRDALAALR